MMSLTVHDYDTRDDDAVRDAWAVIEAVAAHDVPDLPPMTFEQYTHTISVRGEDFKMARFLARWDGAVIGVAGAYLPMWDNAHLADLLIRVHPGARRRGAGRALLDELVAASRAEGRRVAIGATRSALPGGVPRPGDGGPFAVAVGASEALRSVIRRLDVAEADLSGLDAARAAWTGYSVVAWAGLTPDDLIGEIAALSARVETDAPTGDLDVVPGDPDPDHYRRNELRQAEGGFRAYTAAARHNATGEIAAYTRLLFDPRSGAADQLGTLARPVHRGHRLGLLVKIENILQVRGAEPSLRHVFTQNARENAHMVAINDAIGFRPYSVDIAWQLTL